MFSCLLKRVLPFTLTFAVGATVGGLFKFFGSGEPGAARFTQHQPYIEGRGCRASRRNLVAETKPLVILFKPDARWPRGVVARLGAWETPARVQVTFGANGKIQNVVPAGDWLSSLGMDGMAGANEETELKIISRAVERAARQIQFEPETINSVPVSVTKEIEIHFMAE
jgi:hypothetical protein